MCTPCTCILDLLMVPPESEREALVSDVQLMEVDVFSPEHHNRLEDQRGIAPLSATPAAQNNF